MRRIRYAVAMSLDGYIAGPLGEYDRIIQDPEVDFGEIISRYDTLVMGRRTFEVVTAPGTPGLMPGMMTIVVSRTLRPEDHPGVIVLVDAVEVGVIPIVLGGGVPLVETPAPPTRLRLIGNKAYRSGIMSLEYAVEA